MRSQFFWAMDDVQIKAEVQEKNQLVERSNTNQELSLQHEDEKCGCGKGIDLKGPISYVYALGKLTYRFPNMSIEKELAQVIGRGDTKDLTTSQALRTVLTKRENRYLVKQLCWVFSVGGIETYILAPRDASDLDVLLESLRDSPRPTDIDLVIGMRGPIAGPQICNGLMLPIVVFDHMYSFDLDSLVKSIPRPKNSQSEEFTLSAEELLSKIMHMTDNSGATDEHRALNYLAVRYPAIYENIRNSHSRNYSLTSIDVRPSRLSGARKILDVIFSYTERSTDVVEKYFVRVDVTEEFPFLVTKIASYYDV